MKHHENQALKNMAAASYSMVVRLCLKQVPVDKEPRDDFLAEAMVGTYGELMGANRKICEMATRHVRRHYGKMWPELTADEMEEFRSQLPATARLMQVIYQNKRMRESASLLAVQNGMQFVTGAGMSRFCLNTITHLIDGLVSPLEEKYGSGSTLLEAIDYLHSGDLVQAFSQWFRALQDHGKTNEVRCCRELLMAELAHQQKSLREHISEDQGFGLERVRAYLESIRSIERRLHFLK